jgi:hypothetical protein
MFTVSITDAEQVKNPKNWNQEHDWIKSRWWSATVGYGEWGTWNCPRRPLTEIENGFGSTQEDFENIYKPLAEKFGWGKRILNVKILKKAAASLEDVLDRIEEIEKECNEKKDKK